jgi:hypothetical protein
MEEHELKRVRERNSKNSMELMQRNLSLGYAKLTPQLDDQVLFDFGSVKPKQLKMTTRFYPLDELEDIDKESTKVILKHWAK